MMFLGAFNYFTAHFKRTMYWTTVGNTMIRHILQHTRLLKNFTSRLEQNDVSMSSKAKSFFWSAFGKYWLEQMQAKWQGIVQIQLQIFSKNVPQIHNFVNSQFSSSLETDLNENDENLTPALLLEFSAECGSEEIASVLPSNYPKLPLLWAFYPTPWNFYPENFPIPCKIIFSFHQGVRAKVRVGGKKGKSFNTLQHIIQWKLIPSQGRAGGKKFTSPFL